ncbi:MAG: hypothetical protein A2X36_11415 [Elusimicrobia bacterium GWA2_69_24]|nr:MAG: hypothetical protein A2X36_11415 [Elusimicrobia bacterium GWA2_69_24]
MGDYPNACALLEPLRRAHPCWDTVLANLAKAYVNLGRFSEALSCIEAVMALPGPAAETANSFGYLLYEHRRYEHAVRLYRKAVEIDPNHESSWMGLGAALHRLKGAREAIAPIEHAIELKPDYWRALIYLGHIFDDLKQVKAAKAILDRVPTEKFHHIETLKKIIRMSWRPADRERRKALENRLRELHRQERPIGVQGFLGELDSRMDQASRLRARQRNRGDGARFWEGSPTIVTKGGEAGMALDALLAKVFDKPSRFQGPARARVVRLDRKLCQDILVKLAEFLENYPWLCWHVDGRENPPPMNPERVFDDSGATRLMFYGAEVLKSMKRRFTAGVIDQTAILRLEQAVDRLQRQVAPCTEHHRAWIELKAAGGAPGPG